MKTETLQRNGLYHTGYNHKQDKKETILEKFTYWFRDFIENAE